jgi:hypothetical protein
MVADKSLQFLESMYIVGEFFQFLARIDVHVLQI